MCVSGEMGVERTVSDETEQPSRCESMKDFVKEYTVYWNKTNMHQYLVF